MTRLYGVTTEGIVRLDERDGTWQVTGCLESAGAQCLAVDPGDGATVYAGLRDSGTRRSDDAGTTWTDCLLPERAVFSLAVGAADGAVYAGCEPSRLFVSHDRGDNWRALDALLSLPSRPTWSFPPRPWTSHVRWIAPSPHGPELLLVGIELGGLMRSADGGESWEDHRPGAQRDVHCLAWHPRTPGRAYEAGGGGAALSLDGGETWRAADAGCDRSYTWALAVDPDDADRWYVSASTGPRAAHSGGDPEARIYRWTGDGRWQEADAGFPDPMPGMPYSLVALGGGRVVAGLSNGELWESRDGGANWRRGALDGAPVQRILQLVAAT